LHTFQFTGAHALGFSVSTSRLLATDLNTEISTSNHCEGFLLFRLHSGTSELKKFLWTHSSSLRLTRNCPELNLLESESYVTTDGQPASLSWNKAPIWGLRPDLCYSQTVPGLFMWGSLSDERTGLSFTITAGPCQRSHSRVRGPWHS
jgi:hypothetical protein